MDLATIIGMVLGLVMIVFGIMVDSSFAVHPDLLGNFVDIPSAIITIGGSLAGLIGANKMPDVVAGFKSMGVAIKDPGLNPGEMIGNIINLSNVARKEGLLALEETAAGIDDAFLKKGLMLVVDGTDPELVRGILETDMDCTEARHAGRIGFWSKWAELGPAWGMIGTLIGLVNMLKKLDDFASIGPNMAVALLTTLYGSVIANYLCGPIAAKLGVNNANEMTMRTIVVEGLLSIQAGENPHTIEEKLKNFLAPADREGVGTPSGGGEE